MLAGGEDLIITTMWIIFSTVTIIVHCVGLLNTMTSPDKIDQLLSSHWCGKILVLFGKILAYCRRL